ncbi:MAG: hypothetical protein AAGJ91_12545 [Pseudomonadota bacterium]
MDRARAGIDLTRALAGAGLVTLFFSEFFFFNEDPAFAVLESADPLAAYGHIGALWLFYIAFALVLSAALSACVVRRWEGLVLAACLFGWAVEGTAIPYVYESVPVTFFWTSVGWHMPVDVLLGVIALPWLLRQGWAASLIGSAGLGLAWGAWSTWVWADDLRLSPDVFTKYALITGGALVVGTALLAPALPSLWAMPRWLALASGAIALIFGFITGIVHPFGLALLASLVGLTLYALRRLGQSGGPGRLPPPAAPAWRALALLPTPVLAAAVYGALWEADLQIVTEDAIILLLIIATCIFLFAIARAFTRS